MICHHYESLSGCQWQCWSVADNCSAKSLVWDISEICGLGQGIVIGVSILLKVSDIIYNVTDWHIKNGMHQRGAVV